MKTDWQAVPAPIDRLTAEAKFNALEDSHCVWLSSKVLLLEETV